LIAVTCPSVATGSTSTSFPVSRKCGAACELPNLPLDDALELAHLYAERGSPKYEKCTIGLR
jgi:hypothetical protein